MIRSILAGCVLVICMAAAADAPRSLPVSPESVGMSSERPARIAPLVAMLMTQVLTYQAIVE